MTKEKVTPKRECAACKRVFHRDYLLCPVCGADAMSDEKVKPKDIDVFAPPNIIARSVRSGERTKADLRKCGCPDCMHALRLLEADE